MSDKKTIIIAGGGTGGHIYPAIAIGRALMKEDANVKVRFVGTMEGLESKILQRENLPLDLIQSGKLNFAGNPLRKLKSLLKIPLGLWQSFRLIRKHQPVFVIGVGGYASAPFVLMAALMFKKTAIWEPNAHPGLANRLLSKIVPNAYLVFAASKEYLSCDQHKVFGMPLREEIENAQFEGRNKLSDRMTILCFGGSQGSLFLNEKISKLILEHPELHEKIYLIHQTGPRDFENIKKKYGDLNCVEVHDFIYDMPTQYRKADIQFCRGGASTIAEASAFGVVPIIVPLPAADDHQLRNAEVVAGADAGFLFKQDGFSDSDFLKTVQKLIENPELRREMSANLRKLAPQGAARQIARDILREIGAN